MVINEKVMMNQGIAALILRLILILGSYHFLPGGGDHLFVMDGRQFFLAPPFAYVKKFWSPLCLWGKILVPTFGLVKIIWSPPPKVKEHPPHTNNGGGFQCNLCERGAGRKGGTRIFFIVG